ncbi:MAG: ABC transporter permease [Gemmatimonadota bacterium]
MIRNSDSIGRVWGLVVKEFRQVFRDPRMARVIFISPLIQLVVFGYAVSTDLWLTSTFVVDHDGSRDSREMVDALSSSGFFEVMGRSDRSADIVRALDHGDAIVGLEIPPDFSSRLREPGGARVQLLLDGTNSNTASVARSYAERIIQAWGLEAAGAAEEPLAVDLRERAWYNPDLESRNYNVPAVVGALILLVCLLLTSLAIVREREIGTLEQLRVSPLESWELIVGKTLPFAVVGLVDLTIVTTAALLWFGVPFRGSVIWLLASSVLYLASGLGLGLLISTISKTQQEAFMGSFLVFMPAILLSGFMFPVSSMPASFQWLTLLNPVRHYIEIVRAIFLKGAGAADMWPQYAWLAALGAGLLWYASRRFHRSTG